MFNRFNRAHFALTSLVLSAATQSGLAQPPAAPSTIKKPTENAGFRGPLAPPDPPQITLAELQILTGGPTLVTFSGRDVPLSDVTKALIDAAGAPKSLYGGGEEERKLSVEWNRTPFWSAAREVEVQTGQIWDGRFGDGLGLHPWDTGRQSGYGLRGQIAMQTPFAMLVANSLTRTSLRTTTLGERPVPPASTSEVRMTLATYFDPKLQVQSITARAVKFQKQGENAPLAGGKEGIDHPWFGNVPSSIQPVHIDFPPQAEAGTVFSLISGTLHSVLIAASEVFSVPDLIATPTSVKTIGHGQYTLQSASLQDGQLTIRLAATLGEPEAGMGRFGFDNVFANLKVRGAQGQATSSSSSISGGESKAQGTFTFRLQDARGQAISGPYSLDWPITTAIKSLDIPFELRDVASP